MKIITITCLFIVSILSLFAQEEKPIDITESKLFTKNTSAAILNNNQEKVGNIRFVKKEESNLFGKRTSIIKAICKLKESKEVVIDNVFNSSEYIYSNNVLFSLGYYYGNSKIFSFQSINLVTKEKFGYSKINSPHKITFDNKGDFYAINTNGYLVKHNGSNGKLKFKKPIFIAKGKFNIREIHFKNIEFFNQNIYISYAVGPLAREAYMEKWNKFGERIYKKKIAVEYFEYFKMLNDTVFIGVISSTRIVLYDVIKDKTIIKKEIDKSISITQLLTSNKTGYLVAENHGNGGKDESFNVYSISETGILKTYKIPFNKPVSRKYYTGFFNVNKNGNKNIHITNK